MFSKVKKDNVKEKITVNSSNIIGKGTTIKGDIITSGNVRIEGKLLGTLVTKSKAVFGDKSVVEGKIVAQNAEIAGNFNGIIEINELLILKPTAVVNGDIITKKLVFEKDAEFNGKCTMRDNVKPIETVVNNLDTKTNFSRSASKEKQKQETLV